MILAYVNKVEFRNSNIQSGWLSVNKPSSQNQSFAAIDPVGFIRGNLC